MLRVVVRGLFMFQELASDGEAAGCMEAVFTTTPASPVEAAGVLLFYDWVNSVDSTVFDVPAFC